MNGDNERLALIYVPTDEKQLNAAFSVGETIEDLCIKICKLYNIGPVARHLFALRDHSSKLWFPYGHKLEGRERCKFDFRLRFRPHSMRRLKETDEHAYNYYFQQVRADILENKVPDIIYEKHKRELIGLGVSDMYRVMLEKKIPRETVESDYKKYIPKECIKRHAFFIKRPIHNALGRISGPDPSYVKEAYLKQFESIAPNYPYEEYKAQMDKSVRTEVKISVRINNEEVRYCEVDSGKWVTLCTIEDLCFISIRNDNTVEVSRKDGIPWYLRFTTNALLMSFVSALDGYYRLSVKWIFNLCRDVITPTLERLHKLKCHGPVGKEFSYAKLKEKRANRPGAYLLRESETEYNVYYIDVYMDGKLLTQKIEQLKPNEFLLSYDMQKYLSLGNLISSFKDSTNSLYLAECLPPSEYDISPLLLCASKNIGNEVKADEKIIATLFDSGPRCVSQNQLQIHHKTFYASDEDHNRASATEQYYAMWRIAKGKKLEVAMKILKSEKSNYTKDFLELADKWGQLRSGALVRLFGIMVSPTIGMLFELVELGPLDKYLCDATSQMIKTVDMVEATACLATALWHLEQNRVVHGNIRCKNLFVHAHTENSFIVKLADPGLFAYTEVDIHWIPPECYEKPETAKRSFKADIWAAATTIWQIFSRGMSPPVYLTDTIKGFYDGGHRLCCPNDCPDDVYQLMLDCWGEKPKIRDNPTRMQPQAIMRDINRILYQVYNSRRTHTYESTFSSPKLVNDIDRTDEDISDTLENKSEISSMFTDRTSLNSDDTNSTRQHIRPDRNHMNSIEELSTFFNQFHPIHGNSLDDMMGLKNGICNNNSVKSDNGNITSFPIHMFDLDMNCNLILQGRIGQGFYGEVFKATIEWVDDDGRNKDEPELVAVKKLKKMHLETDVNDFEREIEIMKTLRHDNIVKILAATSDPEVCLVMEYIKNGSLQSYLSIHRETLTHKKLLGFALDIATGMDYLGNMNIVHRDLAARNILVANENQVKISDFGLAQVTGKNDYYILQTNRDLPIKWYAPESLRDGKFSKRTDVWSFGVTMYEIFSFGEDPMLPVDKMDHINHGSNLEGAGVSYDLLTALEKGTRLPCPPTCSHTVYVKLMLACWHIASHQRPTFATLCQDIEQILKEY